MILVTIFDKLKDEEPQALINWRQMKVLSELRVVADIISFVSEEGTDDFLCTMANAMDF